MTTAATFERPYDPADLSSAAFWSGTAVDRERTFAELRRERPISWHPPVENALFQDPDDRGFWAVVRHADLVEVTRRHQDFISGKGIVFDSMPQELLDAGQGFIAMDPPRHTKIRRLLASAFTPKSRGESGRSALTISEACGSTVATMKVSTPTSAASLALARSLSMTASTPAKDLPSRTTGIPPPPQQTTTKSISMSLMISFFSTMVTGSGDATTRR